MISDAAIAELKLRNPCDQVAGQWVKLRRHGKKFVGPCPLHSPDPAARDSTSFECEADGWVCATCHDGGDVIRLVALRHGLDPRRDFLEAAQLLGGFAELSAERAAELDRERQIRKTRREQEANQFRERERRTAFDIWHAGRSYAGTPVEDYLKTARGIAALPERLQLRFAPIVAFFHGEETDERGRRAPRVIHRGPAMLAPIVSTGSGGDARSAAGKFRGVHITWLDLQRPNGKALIKDPESGEPLLPKKVRGSQAGNAIRLVDMPAPAIAYAGEGIETVLSVWYALNRAGAMLERSIFWSTVSLGNLAGKSAEPVPHPNLKDAAGRVRRVPGPTPDLGDAGIAFPETLEELVLLGDGDSDRFATALALNRAVLRHSRAGRRVSVAWSPDDTDFNDELRREEKAA
jgi:hypothetical protein